MSKVKLFIAISLDGYIATESGSIEWLNHFPQDEVDDSYETFYNSIGNVIMGSTTYRQITEELADVYPYADSKSYVLTSQTFKPADGVTFVNKNVSDVVKDIKSNNDYDIWIVGGSSIVKPLVENDEIDEYIIAIAPILLGKGIPLFKHMNESITLNLINTYRKNQLVYLNYEKKPLK